MLINQSFHGSIRDDLNVHVCVTNAADMSTFQRACLVCGVIATGNYNDIKTGGLCFSYDRGLSYIRGQ